jgi:hypothetical protein
MSIGPRRRNQTWERNGKIRVIIIGYGVVDVSIPTGSKLRAVL